VLNFTSIHIALGDVAITMAGEDASPEYVQTLRKRFGLDKPIYEQLAVYILSVL
jgi:peptide/nickel transport system permease protein